MSILRPHLCKNCKRNPKLTERNGGWSVDCKFQNPIIAMDDNVAWCDGESHYGIFDTPNDAIFSWNKDNPYSGLEHKWKNFGFNSNINAWYCINPNCSAKTIIESELNIKDCVK